jgi:uncharacterized membrane protein YvbJ
MERCAKCGETLSIGASDCAKCGALVEPRETERSSPSRAARIGEFALLLVVWAGGFFFLVFLALLSISKTIVNAMLGVSAVSLLLSLLFFFTRRRLAAWIAAAAPSFLVAALIALAVALPLFL